MNHSGSASAPALFELHVRIGDVVLEGMHELVSEHVIGGFERARKWQNDAPLEGLGDTAGALADGPGYGVGLTENAGRWRRESAAGGLEAHE